MKKIKEVFKNGTFTMRRSTITFDEIVKTGKFKNQMETRSSGGALNIDLRKQITEELFGVNISNLQTKDFEKYGYLSNKSFLEDITSQDNEARFYGQTIIHFKKKFN